MSRYFKRQTDRNGTKYNYSYNGRPI